MRGDQIRRARGGGSGEAGAARKVARALVTTDVRGSEAEEISYRYVNLLYIGIYTYVFVFVFVLKHREFWLLH